MSPRKRELFEILNQSGKANSDESSLANPLPGEGPGEEIEPYRPPPQRTPEESPSAPAVGPPSAPRSPSAVLVPVLFFITVLCVLFAYGMGYRAGQADLPARLMAEKNQTHETVAMRTGLAPAEALKERRYNQPVWPSTAYAIKLITYPKNRQGRLRAVADRNYANRQPLLKTLNLTAAVLENDLAYSVCIGAHRSSLAPNLDKARRAFMLLEGPVTTPVKKPYAGLSIERVRDLGVAIH
ncbi:MAG: hypothetical protein ACYTGH_08865 [Planctomycetota bacterium]|jgi:hypothetical protein